MNRRHDTAGALERAGFLLFCAIAIVPMALSLIYAVAYSVGLAGLLSSGFTLRHWEALFSGDEIWTSLAVSLYIAAVAMVVNLVAALAIALYLRRPLTNGPLSYAIYLPLALPGTVLAFVVFQALSGTGYLSRLALHAGLIDGPSQFPDLVNDRYGIGIIVAQAIIGVPFFAILFAQIYEGERVHDLVQLARTLGADRRQALLRVTVPLLLRRAFPTVMLYTVGVLGAYEVPLLLGTQSPQMISLVTMRKYAMFDLSQKPQAFICAILYTVISTALIIIAYRSMRRGEIGR
jgi:putative spermidine/putrescine transport system permease protein